MSFELFAPEPRSVELERMFGSLSSSNYVVSTLSYHDIEVYARHHHIPVKLRRLKNNRVKVMINDL